MPQGKPRCGEKYLHFKDKLYQIVAVAEHSETGEELVIYQALYGDFRVYARPLSMFISEVDHEKYPEVEQKYRFRLVDSMQETAAGQKMTATEPAAAGQEAAPKPAAAGQEAAPKPAAAGQEAVPKPAAAGQETATSEPAQAGKNITELLMDFYDASTYEEKYKILTAMKDDVTDVMINNMAVVLDVVIPEGEPDIRFEELKRCLRTYQKYETSRFR